LDNVSAFYFVCFDAKTYGNAVSDQS